MIRNMVAFTTGQGVHSRAIHDDEGRFIASIMFPSYAMSEGTVEYLRSIGFGDEPLSMVGAMVKSKANGRITGHPEVDRWNHRTIKHEESRYH